MQALSYEEYLGGVRVKMGRDLLGTISTVKGGYQYQPRGSRLVGDVFPTLAECKASLAA